MVDALVVGGGINGVGIARDLAGRGLSVALAEREDLARHTSSASTKLVHGGLRYLEHREFGLVRKALAEREGLLRSAPHLMWPLRFVMPHDPAMRPAWMIRAGLFLYDHLARREWLPASHGIDLRRHPAGAPLQQHLRRGFVYADGWADDARLVVANARDAADRGAEVWTRRAVVGAERRGDRWTVSLRDADGTPHTLQARSLVNAAGPWAARFLADAVPSGPRRTLRLVKGSHVVTRRLFDHDHAYLFQNSDGRILFAIPYEGDFTLVGTTDVEHHGAIGDARCDDAEIAYLCEQASRWFARPVTPADVVWTYSGVRPLLDDEHGDPSAVTRDYAIDLDDDPAPLLNVWGGKLTTYRRLAEEAADRLAPRLGATRGAWTADAPLPGGDLRAWIGEPVRPDHDFERFVAELVRRHPGRDPAWLRRLARTHGGRVDRVLDRGPLGAEVAAGLFEAELRVLHDDEWARTADDVLWRRTKLGLHLAPADRARVDAWCRAHWGDPTATPAFATRDAAVAIGEPRG